MRLIIAAIGRMKNGPERELIDRYKDRISKSGKAVGISSFDIIEIAESREQSTDARKTEEAALLLSKLPENCTIVCFDERGKTPSSRKFATSLQSHLDTGCQACAFIIGGPDGLAESWRQSGREVISFGALTMPHQLVRVLVAEQIYRAITIMTGHPYHRD